MNYESLPLIITQLGTLTLSTLIELISTQHKHPYHLLSLIRLRLIPTLLVANVAAFVVLFVRVHHLVKCLLLEILAVFYFSQLADDRFITNLNISHFAYKIKH